MPTRSAVKCFIAADHGGYRLAVKLAKHFSRTIDVQLLTNKFKAGDDYPQVAADLAKTVRRTSGSFGLGICRSGAGMSIVCNKFSGLRAIQAVSPAQAKAGRRDENANVLCLGADYLSSAQAITITRAFLSTHFKPLPRFRRRLREITRYDSRLSN